MRAEMRLKYLTGKVSSAHPGNTTVIWVNSQLAVNGEESGHDGQSRGEERRPASKVTQ